MRPTTEIKAALDGSLSPDQLAPASRSALNMNIYRIACRILIKSDNEVKRQMIDSHPPALQPFIKAECRRIYDLRRGR